MIWVAHEVLRSGASVVLDFGCWSPEERWAIRAVAERAGADFSIEYLRVEESVRRERAARRWREAPHTTFEMTEADHDRFAELCIPPSAAELRGGPVPPPPSPHPTWLHWAGTRWPTLPDLS